MSFWPGEKLRYAETHFKFKLPWSLLYKPWPEIIFDAPFQFVPGVEPYLWIVVRDADHFPTTIKNAEIVLKTRTQNAQAPNLQLQDAQKTLYSTIENYWLNAYTAQQQYIYAKTNVQSMQESYDLVSEQFRLGLKNIIELTSGKTNLLQAEQQMLQSKYTTLYNLAMLRFYQGEAIKL